MIIPPAIDHDQPVRDSRGLVISPDHQAWTRDGSRLTLAPSMDPCPTLAPTGTCAFCGQTDAEIVVRWQPPDAPSSELDLSGLRALVESYQVCRDMHACFERARKAAAERAQAIEAAPAQKALPAPAKAASPIRPKRRSRPSTARPRQERLEQTVKADGDG